MEHGVSSSLELAQELEEAALNRLYHVLQVPNVAKISAPTPGNSGGHFSLANSLGSNAGVDMSANLATSRVLASNNLAAQQVRLYAEPVIHAT